MAFNRTERGDNPRRRTMHRRKKVCVFCGKDNVIDYKDVNKLKGIFPREEKSYREELQGTVQSIRGRLQQRLKERAM